MILSLEDSGSFRTTHTIIAELRKGNYYFSDIEIDWLLDIAIQNSQVNSILHDSDISRFYNDFLQKLDEKDERVQTIKKLINQ